MTTNIDQKAREIMDAIEEIEQSSCSPLCQEIIIEAILSVRNQTLEEAAGVLRKEAQELRDGPGYWDEEIQDYERLSDAIRSLKDTTR